MGWQMELFFLLDTFDGFSSLCVYVIPFTFERFWIAGLAGGDLVYSVSLLLVLSHY